MLLKVDGVAQTVPCSWVCIAIFLFQRNNTFKCPECENLNYIVTEWVNNGTTTFKIKPTEHYNMKRPLSQTLLEGVIVGFALIGVCVVGIFLGHALTKDE